MGKRLVALLLSASLVLSCGQGATPGPGGSGPGSPSTAAMAMPSPGGAATAALAPTPTQPPFVRLAWEEASLPGFPRYRYVTNVNTSARGTLIRYLERADSPSVAVLVTRDGRAWTQATSPATDTPLGRAIEGGPDWLQVMEPLDGSALEVLVSSDGVAWQERGRLPMEVGRVTHAALNGRTIIVCGAARDTTVPATCAVSTDVGATWARVSQLDAMLRAIRFLGLAATPGGFAAVFRKLSGRDVVAVTATSVDGVSWDVQPDAVVAGISPEIAPRFAGFRGVLVIWATVLEGGEFLRGLWTSTDGRAWRRVPIPRLVAWSGELEVVNGAVIGLADEGRGDDMHYVAALVSGDGLTWRADTLPSELTTRHSWEWRTTPLPDGLLVLEQGTGSATETPRALVGRPVATSDPGPAPASSPTPVPQPSGAAPPRLAWAVGPSQPGFRVADVVAWNGGFLAVGYGVTADEFGTTIETGPAAWVSTDGLSWTRTLDPGASPGSPGAGAARMLAVTVRNGVIVAAGDAPGPVDNDDSNPQAAFWRSLDGRSWQRVPDRSDFIIGIEPLADSWITGLFDLAAGGPGFVAVGATRSGGATVWTSTDGWDWRLTATLGSAVAEFVSPGGPGMVILGQTGGPQTASRAWTSPDGLTWSAVQGLPSGPGGRMATLGTSIVAAGLPPWRTSDGLLWEKVADQPAFARVINDEGMFALVAAPWGHAGAGGIACADAFRACPVAWTSADGLRWEKTMLPEAAAPWPGCPSCRVIPVAAALDGRRVVAVGATYSMGGPYDRAPGWASWVGTLSP